MASGIGDGGDSVAERAVLGVERRTEIDFDELYRSYCRDVARWAARLGGPGIEPEDVVHEVFLVAKRRLRRFDANARITTWLFRTTHKTVSSIRRKLRVRNLLARMLLREAPNFTRAVATPLEDLERAQSAVHVYRALDCLGARERQVLVLFEFEGLSTEQIAELMGARVGTIRVWLHRARARFAVAFEKARESEASRGGTEVP